MENNKFEKIIKEINNIRNSFPLSNIKKNKHDKTFEKIYIDKSNNKIKLLIDNINFYEIWFYQNNDEELYIELPATLNKLLNLIFNYNEKEIDESNKRIKHDMNNLLMIFQEANELDKNDINNIHDMIVVLKEEYEKINNNVIMISKVMSNEEDNM